MKTRPLQKNDMPKRPKVTMNVPVLYKGEIRRVVDRHRMDENFVYLNNAKGKSTPIKDLELITGSINPEEKIEKKRTKIRELREKIIKLEEEIGELKKELD